jgi:hypothetical protein
MISLPYKNIVHSPGGIIVECDPKKGTIKTPTRRRSLNPIFCDTYWEMGDWEHQRIGLPFGLAVRHSVNGQKNAGVMVVLLGAQFSYWSSRAFLE